MDNFDTAAAEARSTAGFMQALMVALTVLWLGGAALGLFTAYRGQDASLNAAASAEEPAAASGEAEVAPAQEVLP